ncbi:terminase large subunit domain-containing protein [Saccharibacillus brassicae]|uniref:DNA packaging protein n=1 Tax=Saccharibacillus brassicae TaxID=2583377 RepID=A0A4Y6URV9_SACBS|nr:terminase family protein [Saccharibacillus brassicae]QDH19784.1 DNA packaging protein [Saccharibacillus brassicae]
MSIAARKGKLSTKEKFNLIMDDFQLFARNFIKIIDNNSQVIPFVMNDEQSDFIGKMQKFNIILKSRQIGFSTMSLGYCLFNAVKYPNTRYMIVSLSNESVSGLFNTLKFMNDNLPRDKFSFPNTVRDNRGELVLNNGSRIQVASAEGKSSGIGRGQTFNYILLSEYAFYPGDQSKILVSLEQALAKNDKSKLVIETTANGAANFYYDLFQRSWKGKTNYNATFYGWISSAHRKQFKYEIDLAEEWYRAKNKGQRLHESDLSKIQQKLFEDGATLGQLMWREWKLSGMADSDFQQEFPSNPTEAFKTSGQNVFDQAKILERLEYIPEPLDKFELQSELPELLYSLLDKGLSIYHLCKHNQRYYGGVDVSSGSGNDFQALSIMNVDGEQVATFSNNKVSVYKFAEIIDAIGRYFNYALMAVERNGYGLPTIERLRNDYEYMNLYKHRTFDKKGNKRLELGWLTTDKTKAIMISDFKEAFEKRFLLINDKETLSEMMIFVEQNGKTGNKKGSNNHDDNVIAACLSWQSIKSNKWYVDN